MLKALLIASGALVAAPLMAQAADLGMRPAAGLPMIAQQYTWTGFHIGLGGGGQHTSAKSSVSGFEEGWYTTGIDEYQQYGQSSASSGDLGKFSGFGAIDVGYDYQFSPMFVAGIFGGFDFGTSRASHGTNGLDGYNSLWEEGAPDTWLGDGGFSGSLSTKVEVGNSWNAGVRLGFLPVERTLVYGLVGYSSANIKSSGTLTTAYEGLGGADDFGGTISTGTSKWKGGLLLGAGIETALTDQVSLKLEYRHADYGRTSSTYAFANSGPDFVYETNVTQSKKITTDSVRAVVSYRF